MVYGCDGPRRTMAACAVGGGGAAAASWSPPAPSRPLFLNRASLRTSARLQNVPKLLQRKCYTESKCS